MPKDAREGIAIKIENGKYTVDYEKQHDIIQNMQDIINKKVVRSGDLYTVNRLDENHAVCENERTHSSFNFSYTEINGEIKEGDILKLQNGSYNKINI